ncbi:MAG: sigma-70 family RNA polymerase sigma factor [Acidobacteriaceae bacterium]|nr:sigma-70 family RNA polymerase sigma factor [Acidobacteriaceae bacterium]
MEERASGTWTDEEWLDALASRGDEAKAELCTLLLKGLRRAFSSRPEVLEWTDDFAQEAAVRVLQQLATYRGESRFTTWALAIAMRVSFDELRHRRWRDVSLDAMPGLSEKAMTPSAESGERLLARQKIFAELKTAIARDLSDKQRLALTAELKELPQSEIAKRIGSTRNAVYKLTHDAAEVEAGLGGARDYGGNNPLGLRAG